MIKCPSCECEFTIRDSDYHEIRGGILNEQMTEARGINSTSQLMELDVKELEHLKRETFKQWDRLGAIITLKEMESEEK